MEKKLLAKHAESRRAFSLPTSPLKDPSGKLCPICALECIIPEDGAGYCGLKEIEKGKLLGSDARFGKLSWYLDPLPTNCVADWICSAGIDFENLTHKTYCLKQEREL